MSPASSKDDKEKLQEKKRKKQEEEAAEEEKKKAKKKKKKESSRSVWTIPTEKLWGRGCGTPTLPLYHPAPSTPIKGTNVSRLKEMNGWK